MTFVDQLEDQRRELEARRFILEERYKLRLATAQEFGVVHTRRLDRVRKAFTAQCAAARRRNQDTIQRVQQTGDPSVVDDGVSGGTSKSRNRLSYHTERFLSVARRLYPAWQERQFLSKTMELRALEEESFVTDQRRRWARGRFEQEQNLQTMVEERRRRLAAMQAHERNESALRRPPREREASHCAGCLLQVVEHPNKAGRAARRKELAVETNRSLGYRMDHETDQRAAVTLSAISDEELLAGAQTSCIDIDARKDNIDEVFGRPGGDDYAVGDAAAASKRGSYDSGFGKNSSRVKESVNDTLSYTERDRQFCMRSDSSYASLVNPNGNNATVSSKSAAPKSSTQITCGYSTSHPFLPPPSDINDKAAEGTAEIGGCPRTIAVDISPPPEAALSSWQDRHESFSAFEDSEVFGDKEARGGRYFSGGRDALKAKVHFPAAISADKSVVDSLGNALASPWSENDEQDPQGCHRRPEHQAKGRRGQGDTPMEIGSSSNAAGGSRERCDRGAHQNPGVVDPPTCSSTVHLRLSLSTAARALAALTLQIEKLASRTETSLPLAPSTILVGYHSADAEPLAHRQSISEAAITAGEASGSIGKLARFNQSVLCGAVLELVTNHAEDILPAEALLGVVDVGKVRAQHRLKTSPGKLNLFDAFVRHTRHLTTSEGVDPGSVADVFAPCFEAVTAERDRGCGSGDRRRRKVRAFLQSAADSDRQVSKCGSLPVSPIVTVSLELPARGGGGGIDDTTSVKFAGEINKKASETSTNRTTFGERWTSEPVTGLDRPSTRQQKGWRQYAPDHAGSRVTSDNETDSSETDSGLEDESTKKRRDVDVSIAVSTLKDTRSTAETLAIAGECDRKESRVIKGSGVVLGDGGLGAKRKKHSLDLSVMCAGGVGAAAAWNVGCPLQEFKARARAIYTRDDAGKSCAWVV